MLCINCTISCIMKEMEQLLEDVDVIKANQKDINEDPYDLQVN